MAQCPGLTSQHIALLKNKLPGCEVSVGETEQEPEIGLVDE